jgi:hypothetical protein
MTRGVPLAGRSSFTRYPDDPEADLLVGRIRVRQAQLDARRIEEVVRSAG